MANVIRFAALCFVFFSLTACGVTMATTKFDWKATESAPNYFPMEIMRGYFHAPDGYSLYVPNKKLIFHGWGRGISNHLVGPDVKPLPSRLEIAFYSYVDDKFYQGDFKLPYEKILKSFQQGYFSPKEDGNTTYFEIIAGVAPGGHVSVWLGGIDRTSEVFSGEAEEIEMEWSNVTDNTEMTRQAYRDEMIDYSRRKLDEDRLKKLQETGVPTGLWQDYRKRYSWELLFTGNDVPDLIDRVRYYNGEDEYLLLPLDEEFTARPHPVPKMMVFKWALSDGKPRLMEIYFDEDEIRSAFDTLGKSNEPLHLRFHTEQQENGKPGLWVVLQKADNEKERVILRKMRVEFFGV